MGGQHLGDIGQSQCHNKYKHCDIVIGQCHPSATRKNLLTLKYIIPSKEFFYYIP